MILYARVTLGTMSVPSLRDLRGRNKVKMQPKWGKVAKLLFDPEQGSVNSNREFSKDAFIS